jgi:hypothetical protein
MYIYPIPPFVYKIKTIFIFILIFLFILTQSHIYFKAPREGGACDFHFPNRDNNICRYYFVGAESRNLI